MLKTRSIIATQLYPVDGIVMQYLLSVSREWKRIGFQEEYETCLQCPENEVGEMLFGMARSGNLFLLKVFLQHDKLAYDLKGACRYHLLIHAINGACRGGHQHVFDYLYFKYGYISNYCIEEAARGGHKDLVVHLEKITLAGREFALCGAARGGHKHIMDWAIDNGASADNSALDMAARGGHLELVKMFMELTQATDFANAMNRAGEGGHIHIIQYLISRGEPFIDGALIGAIDKQRTHVVRYLLHKYKIDTNKVLRYACFMKDRDLISEAIDRGATYCNQCFKPIHEHFFLTRENDERH